METKKFNVGIDLGTTNSVFCVYNERYKRPDVLKIYGKSGITPSVIYYDVDNDKFIIGEEAKEQVDYYSNSFAFLKIKMTKGDEIAEEHNGKSLTPIEFSSLLLEYMYNGFKEHYGDDAEIQNLVITVPAYFKDKERKCTLEAVKKAKIKVNGEIRLINEPTAAALAYGDELSNDKTIVTYDLGGGTFDVTLLEIDDIEGVKIFQAIKTDGKTLGGYDFDKLLIEKILNDYLKISMEKLDKEEVKYLKSSLKSEAEKIKISLSKLDNVKGTCIAFGKDKKYLIDYEVSREDFDKLIESAIDETIEMTKKITKGFEIDDFVLVGGSTRIPLVEEKLKKEFKGVNIVKVDPDLIVGLGAAIQAGIIDKKRDAVLNEILSGGSIGVSVRGDFVSYMVKEGTPIPFSISEKFVTSVRGTNKVEAYIVQGKDPNLESRNNLILGKISLDNLVVNRQASIINVKINVNKSGEVEIVANETVKGGSTTVKLFKIGEKSNEIELTKFKNNDLFEDKNDSFVVITCENILNQLENDKIILSPDIKNWFADEIDEALKLENIERMKYLIVRFFVTIGE